MLFKFVPERDFYNHWYIQIFSALTFSQTSPGSYVSAEQVFENTVGKGEIARNEQFLLFPQCFLSIWRTFCHFHQIWNCRLQTLSVWNSLKFVVWERVKSPLLLLRTKSITKKEINKCMAEIYDPGGIWSRAARLISQYHNHWAKENSP